MKKLIQTTLFCALMFFGLIAVAQPTPAPAQSESILIVAATAHLGTGEKIENAAIGFVNGKINFVGRAEKVDRKSYQQVIEAKGQHVYPGFIATNSTLGLQEIGSVRATRDQYEVGTFRPNVRAVIAFNTDSEITPTVRTNGVLMGQITPRGGTVSGTSAVVHFDAWNWEDAAIEMEDGIHVNWPSMYHRHREGGKVDIQKVKTYDQSRHEIERFFGEAKAFCQGGSKQVDLRFAAMCEVFNGDKRLYVHADGIKEIKEAVAFKNEMGINHLVIVGGYDSYLCADMLREQNVPVILRRVHSMPWHSADDIDLPYKLPKLLEDEGVLFCLQNAGGMEQMGTRNLPFYAGTAVAYGLTYEQGVAAISLNAAKILGVDKQCGSLEKGKDATLFISEGDALDMMTNSVSFAFIQGRQIDLDNRQKQLYRKYMGKYEAAGK
jgi:imidazolonepropionase-like amidohydrolase